VVDEVLIDGGKLARQDLVEGIDDLGISTHERLLRSLYQGSGVGQSAARLDSTHPVIERPATAARSPVPALTARPERPKRACRPGGHTSFGRSARAAPRSPEPSFQPGRKPPRFLILTITCRKVDSLTKRNAGLPLQARV